MSTVKYATAGHGGYLASIPGTDLVTLVVKRGRNDWVASHEATISQLRADGGYLNPSDDTACWGATRKHAAEGSLRRLDRKRQQQPAPAVHQNSIISRETPHADEFGDTVHPWWCEACEEGGAPIGPEVREEEIADHLRETHNYPFDASRDLEVE